MRYWVGARTLVPEIERLSFHPSGVGRLRC